MRPEELRAAICAVLEPATGEGLHEVLAEVLPDNDKVGQLSSGESESDIVAVAPEDARHALIAALLYAERQCAPSALCPSGLLPIAM